MNRSSLVIATAGLAMALTGCGAQAGDDAVASAPSDPGAGGVAAMCAQDQPDCVDTPQLASDEPVAIDETAVEQFRRDAKYYLGRPRDEVPELIRIARIDDDDFAVTDDYQVGRITVELDDVDGDGNPVVTSATVELPDGPETFELEE